MDQLQQVTRAFFWVVDEPAAAPGQALEEFIELSKDSFSGKTRNMGFRQTHKMVTRKKLKLVGVETDIFQFFSVFRSDDDLLS